MSEVEIIAQHFGFPPNAWQNKAIAYVLAVGDAIISAGTGSGKSLVFQGSALLLEKGQLIIVVSPLNALIDNHVSNFFFSRGRGLEA